MPDEPQTDFMPPPEGGSYVRNADGSLTRVEGPTAPAGFTRDADGGLVPITNPDIPEA